MTLRLSTYSFAVGELSIVNTELTNKRGTPLIFDDALAVNESPIHSESN
jgi:hypothetical protein